MRLLRVAGAIVGKELRLEFRTRELLTTTVVFSVVVVLLFSFSFDPTSEEARRIGPGLLWLAFLFSGSLMLHPTFTREQASDTLAALRMAPVDAYAVLLGKTLANFVFMVVAEALLLPVFAVFYNVSLLPVLGRLAGVLLLGTLGMAASGTVFAAISAQARLRELLLPLLMLLVLTPVLIASVECTAGLLADPPEWRAEWLKFLAGFDVIFLAAGFLLSDYLLEE